MAVKKFLTVDDTGVTKLMDVGVVTSTGAADGGKAVVLRPDGTIDSTLLPAGIGGDTLMMTASESLNGGDFVNVWDDDGAFKIRKSDGTTNGKAANAYVLDTAAAGEQVKVYFEGTNTAVSGVVPGPVYLSTTAGGSAATPPTAPGTVIQRLGIGVSATSINVEFAMPILRA